MPIFEYKCADCGQTFELLVLGSSQPECSGCGSQQLTKLISAPVPPRQASATVRRARAQAEREGHFSNYSAAERSRM